MVLAVVGAVATAVEVVGAEADAKVDAVATAATDKFFS
jgi:hypothetical protein